MTGRALDALKLAVGAFAVFLLGNYVNFQPWDRDNCKLFNVWLMIASGFSGALLAAPFEYLALRSQPGIARISNLTGTSLRAVRDSLYASSGAAGSDKGPKATAAGKGSPIGYTASMALSVVSVVCLILSCATGFFMIRREFAQYHVLLDEEQAATAEWISTNLAPKANFLHKDVHITPSGTLAGRSALISYNGEPQLCLVIDFIMFVW